MTADQDQGDGSTFDERAALDQGTPEGAMEVNSLPAWMESVAKAPPSLVDQGGEAGDGGAASDQGGTPYDEDIRGLSQAGEAIMAKSRANTQRGVEALEENQKKIDSTQPPKLDELPKAPGQPFSGKQIMGYMQIATLMGALAGSLGRKNSTVALTAFAGAIQGFAKGNSQLFDQNMERWKAASEKVKSDNQAKLDAYRQVLDNNKLSIDNKMSAIKLIAQQYGDEITYNLAQQRQFEAMANNYEKQVQLNHTLAHQTEVMRMMGTRLQQSVQQQKDLQDGGADLGRAVLSGEMPPSQLGSYKEKVYALKYITANAGKNGNPTMSQLQLEWIAAQQQVKNLNGAAAQKYSQLAVSVVNTIDKLTDLSEQLKLGGVPIANAAELQTYVQTQGNTAKGQLASQYLANVGFLSEEMAQLAQGGYAPTESAWQQARTLVNGNYGTQQLEATLKSVRRLIQVRLNSMSGFKEMGPYAPNRFMGRTQLPEELSGDQAPPGGSGSDLDGALERLGIGVMSGGG